MLVVSLFSLLMVQSRGDWSWGPRNLTPRPWKIKSLRMAHRLLGWTPMSARILLAAVLLAGCTASSPGSDGGTLPDLSSGGDGGMCTRTCTGCVTGENCYVPAGTANYRAFCARACGVSSDCPGANQRCTALFN